MKNSTPQSDPRQNNCRNTTSPTITPPTREWTTANCRGTLTMHIAVAVLCDWGRHTQKPRSLSRSGFSLSPRRSTLSKPPRRFGDDDDLYRLTSIFLHFSVIAYTQRRGGGQWFVSLDFADAERRVRIDPADEATPESIFVQRWARTLLDRVFDELRGEMVRAGHAQRFDRMTDFLVGSEPAIPYRQLAADLGMSEGAVKVAVHRMRQRFGLLLRQEVEHTVDNEDAVADEIRYLIGALAS